LTGQQKAIERYLQLLADARGSRPVDPLRWGAALVRVSKLTEIPAEDLNRRFKARIPRAPATKAVGGQQPTNAVSQALRDTAPRPTAQETAQRQILGILLIEPRRWADVQAALRVEDFATASLRTLAEAFWQHQHDQPEAVFNQFLDALPDAALKQSALELVNEVEELSDLERTLADAMGYLAEIRRKRENQKLLAAACRPGEEQLTEEQLRKVQESARQPDLRRLGC
jgi:hypothetical protein